jgi:hypothetical protein
VASALNIPMERMESRASWKDPAGNFWFYGGYTLLPLNDLWMYCLSANQWIWMDGDSSYTNFTNNWGTLGVSNPANKPNPKGGALGWTNGNGVFYLFGGISGISSSNVYNDLWKYTIDTACGVCPASTGIPENNFTNELFVFPNPTNSFLSISFPSPGNQTIELRIYSTLGQLQFFQSFKSFEKLFQKEINVEELSEGIYFLQLKTKDGTINRKVIINH